MTVVYYRHCFKAYENGLKDNLPPKKRYKLWIFFIDHVIEIWKVYGMENETIQRFVNEVMEKVFQEAYDNGVLHKAEHYVYWVNFISHPSKLIETVIYGKYVI